MSIKLNLEDTIAFERPLTRVVKQNITIQNPNDKAVAFKVKTTAPKLYCVRPNSDVIPPNGTIDVQIMLQAQREEPPLDVKCRDKFLILSTYVNEFTEKMGITELWNHVEEKNDKNSIHQHKLRCVYIPSKETEATTAPAPAAAAAAAAAPASLPSKTPVTAAPASAATNADASANTKESVKSQEDVIEKMKAMERELSKYKEAEKLEVKTGFPPSIYILISLMIAAIAYFMTTK